MKFPLPVKAVMIDLDGTLVDTIEDIAAAVNAMLEELRLSPLAPELIRNFVGKGMTRLVERALDASDAADAASIPRAQALYERHYEVINGRHASIYPGVKEGLDAFETAGFPLACMTNKIERFTRPLLERIGLARYFNEIVAGDTLPEKKPHPAPLLHACATFGVKPREMLMIGDSINDAEAARAAGCPIFCVSYGYNEGLDVHDLDTDAVLTSLAEAPRLIAKA